MKDFLDSIKELLFIIVIGAIVFSIGGMLAMITIKFLIWFYAVLF